MHIFNSNCQKVKISTAPYKYVDDTQRGVSIHFLKISEVKWFPIPEETL